MTPEHEKTGSVRWPQRRHTLACYLYELASPDFQHERWIEGRGGTPGTMYGFSLIVNFFFDDTELAKNPGGTVGDILLDELELAVIRNVGKALSNVLGEIGVNKSDRDYVSSRGWSNVIVTSQKAYRLLRSRMVSGAEGSLPPELESPE